MSTLNTMNTPDGDRPEEMLDPAVLIRRIGKRLRRDAIPALREEGLSGRDLRGRGADCRHLVHDRIETKLAEALSPEEYQSLVSALSTIAESPGDESTGHGREHHDHEHHGRDGGHHHGGRGGGRRAFARRMIAMSAKAYERGFEAGYDRGAHA